MGVAKHWYGYGLADRFTAKISFVDRLRVKLPERCTLKRVNASQPLHEQVPCPSTKTFFAAQYASQFLLSSQIDI